MDKPKKVKCIYCGKYLQAIGTARKNGKFYHKDWKNRKAHKKCWLKNLNVNNNINL